MSDEKDVPEDAEPEESEAELWLAAALLDIEPRLRRLLGYRHLPLLRAAIQRELGISRPDCITPTAAGSGSV